jgi:hypothetical protein
MNFNQFDDKGTSRQKLNFTIAAALFCHFTASGALGVDNRSTEANENPDAPARQLLERLFSERGELLSGEYTAMGRTVRRFGPKFEESKGDIAVDCAFDSVRDLLRWEREEPRLFLDADRPDESGAVTQTGYRFIKTPDKCYVQDLLNGVGTTRYVTIAPPPILSRTTSSVFPTTFARSA